MRMSSVSLSFLSSLQTQKNEEKHKYWISSRVLTGLDKYMPKLCITDRIFYNFYPTVKEYKLQLSGVNCTS